MAAEGLSGPLCWAASVAARATDSAHRVGAGARVADGGGAGGGEGLAPKPAGVAANGD